MPSNLSRKDLTKMQLYESVKLLVDLDAKNIHLPQIKIYTLYSIAFQYLLYHSTEEVGHYIIRLQDSIFAEKLSSMAKDLETRKFTEKLIDTRKLRFNNSYFYLDTFHMGSWHKTSALKLSDIKGVLIVKYTSFKDKNLPANYFIEPFIDTIPKLIVIDPEDIYENFHQMEFPLVTELLNSR